MSHCLQDVLAEIVKQVSEQTPLKPTQPRKPFLAQRPDRNKKSAKGTKWMIWEPGTRQKLLSRKNASLGDNYTSSFIQNQLKMLSMCYLEMKI